MNYKVNYPLEISGHIRRIFGYVPGGFGKVPGNVRYFPVSEIKHSDNNDYNRHKNTIVSLC